MSFWHIKWTDLLGLYDSSCGQKERGFCVSCSNGDIFLLYSFFISVCVYEFVCVSVKDRTIPSSEMPSISFKADPLTDLELTSKANLAGPWAKGILLFPCGCWGLNSGPPVCKTSTLPTELSPQPCVLIFRGVGVHCLFVLIQHYFYSSFLNSGTRSIPMANSRSKAELI